MKAEVLVVHDCDKDKLKAMGLEFIRYTRPVDQFDRISMTRQDRYLYAWVRDKDGNEFAFFVPKDEGVEQRACTLSMSQSMTCQAWFLIPAVRVACFQT